MLLIFIIIYLTLSGVMGIISLTGFIIRLVLFIRKRIRACKQGWVKTIHPENPEDQEHQEHQQHQQQHMENQENRQDLENREIEKV